MKSKIVVLIIATVIFSFSLGIALYKPPIEEATVQELQAIDGIGETLSYRIVEYIDDAENFDINDLTNVDGIGEKRLKLVRKEFK